MPGFAGFTNLRRDYNRNTLYAMTSHFIDPAREYVSHWGGISGEVLGGTARPKDAPAEGISRKEIPNISALGEIYGDRQGTHFAAPRAADKWFESHPTSDLIKILPHVDGYFSACIHDSDSDSDSVYLITDRYGLRRLYYTVVDGNIVWSTDLRSFVEYPGLSCSISHDAVDQFLSYGYCLEDTTWFEGIRLAPAATILTFNLRTSTVLEDCYWSWAAVSGKRQNLSMEDASRELGRRFAKSVQIRSQKADTIGIPLSGGLDSRALCAALPASEKERTTLLTFGTPGCEDIRIASRVAELMRRPHRTFHFDLSRWYYQRIPAIWSTSASCSLLDLHGSEFLGEGFSDYDVVLSGFAGDLVLGGSYLRPRLLDHPPTSEAIQKISNSESMWGKPVGTYYSVDKTDPYFIYNRVRRFTTTGTFLLGLHSSVRIPFFDNDVIEFAYSLSDVYRFGNRLYKTMLLQSYSNFFRNIPWQKAGLPISYPTSIVHGVEFLRRARDRFTREIQGLGITIPNRGTFVDYALLTRQPGFLTFADTLLNSKGSIYPDYTNKEKVSDLLRKHQEQKPGTHIILSRYLTLEIWLQQLLKGKMRNPSST